jgi:hypothetical protein
MFRFEPIIVDAFTTLWVVILAELLDSLLAIQGSSNRDVV